MSQLLLSELTALSSEAKRKSPEVRIASDAALTSLRTKSDVLLSAKGESAIQLKDNVLLQPIILACQGKTSTPKVVGIAVGLLQRVIGLRIVRDEDCPELVNLLRHVTESRNDVEVHLKVLQAVSSLLSGYESIHYNVLAQTLRLCFNLQESRIGVVSSTASATLRQAVMTVFEKVKDEDRILNAIKSGGEDAAASAPLATMTVPLPGTSDSVTLFPCSRDAYLIISDLNALANNDQSTFLGLQSLPRTFTLELIESILTNHAHLFRPDIHPELLLCLRQSTCPLLIKAFNEQPSFPTTLRLIRLLFVLLRQFNAELIVEVEILMSILLRFISLPSDSNRRISSSSEATASAQEHIPTWQRVLAIEATRSLCSDGVLMRNLWRWFDSKPNSTAIFTQLVDTLHNLATERPNLIGIADASFQMDELGSKGHKNTIKGEGRRSSSNIYNTAAEVASAAIGLKSNTDVSALTAVGLSQTSVPSVQLIDQLDKSDAPQVPSTYIYLLALQALVHLAQSMAAFALPIYSRFVNTRPRSAPRAPPSLDFASLSEQDHKEITIVRDMVQQCWAPLLDSFTFFLSAKCDDFLFAEVLIALRNFTNTTGALDLVSPRDALIASLTRFAIPKTVMVRLLSMRSRASGNEEVDAHLSERNAACLKAVTQIAYYLSGSLGTHWRDVLETLCDAEYILRRSINRRKSSEADRDSNATPMANVDAYKPKPSMASISTLSTIPAGFSSAAGIDSTTGRPMALQAIDNATLLNDVGKVFENTTSLGDSALLPFMEALCELDADHVGLAEHGEKQAPAPVLNRSSPLSSLATVSMLNVRRLADSTGLKRAWDLVTQHMLTLASNYALRPSLRMQAATALDNFILSALNEPSKEVLVQVQNQSIEVLAKQSILDDRRKSPVDIDVRKNGIETFFTILQTQGHNLQTGWESLFSVFAATCKSVQSEEDRSNIPLIKIAFNAMQIVCSDLLSRLDQNQLKLCVETLTRFSEQDEDVNISLTAGGTLWGITAEVSSRASKGEGEQSGTDMKDMWIHILSNVRSLTEDSRLQVRNGAISILFSILDQYGNLLTEEVWKTNVMGEILLPLLDSLHSNSQSTKDGTLKKEWDESRVLAFSSTGKIIRQVFVEKLIKATEVWQELLVNIKQGFLAGPSSVSQASIQALYHILQINAVPSSQQDSIKAAMRSAWSVWCEIGKSIPITPATYTQANLLAYVETVTPLYATLMTELGSDEVEVMLSCLKTTLMYAKGKERVSDSERLTALQASITTRIASLQLSPTIVSRVLMDLAEYSSLAFMSNNAGGATYLALNRYATDHIVTLFDQWSKDKQVYRSGALQQIYLALAIPLKLRYDCPKRQSTSADNATPLWKGSLIALCKLVRSICANVDQIDIEEDIKKDIWASMVSALAAALTADCSPILEMNIEEQDAEEVFDLILLITIERDVWPKMGNAYVPKDCIETLVKAIRDTSKMEGTVDRLQIRTPPSPTLSNRARRHSTSVEEEDEKTGKVAGLVAGLKVPREAFAYWCLDLLVLICSKGGDESNKNNTHYRRSAAISLPFLVERFSSTLQKYINDIRLYGSAPLSRIRDEEINYVLMKLSKIQLWPGSLLVASQDNNDGNGSVLQSYLDGEEIQNSSMLHSEQALLFHLYPSLCQFIFFVLPRQGGRSTLMTKATCGCARLYEPIQGLPDGFAIESIGKQLSNQQIGSQSSFEVEQGFVPSLSDPRLLAFDLLQKIGKSWDHSNTL